MRNPRTAYQLGFKYKNKTGKTLEWCAKNCCFKEQELQKMAPYLWDIVKEEGDVLVGTFVRILTIYYESPF